MTLLRAIRCRIAWHRRGQFTHDAAGTYRQCIRCGRIKPVEKGEPEPRGWHTYFPRS